jgi:hypothetical protein
MRPAAQCHRLKSMACSALPTTLAMSWFCEFCALWLPMYACTRYSLVCMYTSACTIMWDTHVLRCSSDLRRTAPHPAPDPAAAIACTRHATVNHLDQKLDVHILSLGSLPEPGLGLALGLGALIETLFPQQRWKHSVERTTLPNTTLPGRSHTMVAEAPQSFATPTVSDPCRPPSRSGCAARWLSRPHRREPSQARLNRPASGAKEQRTAPSLRGQCGPCGLQLQARRVATSRRSCGGPACPCTWCTGGRELPPKDCSPDAQPPNAPCSVLEASPAP